MSWTYSASMRGRGFLMKNEFGNECYTLQKNGKMGFDKVELPFYGDVSLGNGTRFTVGLFKTRSKELFIGIEHMGAYTFNELMLPSYVAQKLRLSMYEAKSITDFIDGQFGNYNQHQDYINDRYI